MNATCRLALSLFFLILSRDALAWNATGHHVISVMAFDLLSEDERAELLRILESHPDFESKFHAPDRITNPDAIDRWRIGIAGCWPDMIRRTAADRPTWHYQLGASIILGDESAVNVPELLGPLPVDATLATKNLYIGQAFDLCRKVFADKSHADVERAIALCWLCHLVADGHQPCHAGSLYAAKVFPNGDRGANSIHVGRGNLHSTWDGLLGGRATPGNVLARVAELRADTETVERVKQQRDSEGSQWIEAADWLQESQAEARRYVYAPEVIDHVTIAMRGITERVDIPQLPESYYTTAGRIARTKAAQAGYRLAAVLSLAMGS
ncbi:MAG: S1/P1 nuclease [Planctomycetaceae bacterium]